MQGSRPLRLDPADRQAAAAGFIALGLLAAAYPVFADDTGRPLAVFLLPGLLAAVLGGWRPTLAVGFASFTIAVAHGLAGPLDAKALVARWLIVGFGIIMGAVGAAVREGQASRLAELDEAMVLREAFERALAPRPIPPEGMVAVARYRPAETRMELGGDFLEAIALDDGRLAMLIGDVCGHGPREAAFGAALRAGWKSIALGVERDPVDWVAALDAAFFRDGRIDTFVTLCTGYFDLGSGTSRLVNAGHPPPVVLGPRPATLDLPPKPPLGIPSPRPRTATDLPWNGDPMLFYTDGLIENPMLDGPPRRWGPDGLVAWLADHVPVDDGRRLLDDLLVAATRGRHVRDDVAVLLVAADR